MKKILFVVFLFFYFLGSSTEAEAKQCGPFRTITIREKETVSKLAELLEVREERFYTLNPELKKRFLIAGEQICIPLPSDLFISQLEIQKAKFEEQEVLIRGQKKMIRHLEEKIESLKLWSGVIALWGLPTVWLVLKKVWEIRQKHRKRRYGNIYVLPK